MNLKIISQSSSKVPGEDWECLMFHNGKLFTSSFANGKVTVWSPDLKPLKEFDAHDYPIYHMTPGPSTTFFTTSSDCTIKHWEDKGNGDFALLNTLSGQEEIPVKVRYDAKRNWLFSGDGMGKVMIWENGNCIKILETLEEIWDMIVQDELLITCRHMDLVINIVSLRDDKILHSVKGVLPGKGPLAIVGDKLCFQDRLDNYRIHVNDLSKTGVPEVALLESHSGIINGLVASPDGKLLFSGGGDKNVMAWSLENFQKIGELSVEGYVNALALNPATGVVYVGGQDKVLYAVKLEE